MGRFLRWAVVAAWLVLIALLVRQQWATPPPAEPLVDPGSAAIPSSEEWMGMYHGKNKIGYVHLSVFGGEGGEYAVQEESFLRLTLLETPQSVRLRVRARAGADHSLKKLSFELDNGGTRFRAEGERVNNELRLRTLVGDQESDMVIPVEGPLYLPASVRRLLSSNLETGKRYEVRVFDPSMMKEQTIVATVVGEQEVPGTEGKRGWRIEEEYAGVKSVAWLDGDGHVMREEGPMGLTLVREPEEVATRENWAQGAALDLVSSVSILVEPPLRAPQSLQHLELRVSGIELDRVPQDERQKLEADLLRVTRETLPGAVDYRLPYSGEDLRPELAATALLQIDHPRVQAAAREAVGDETRPLEAVQRLKRFVYERLRKVPTVSVPNVIQVLDMGEGDCNEHAVLFAGLARAVGLPTRVVAGVVYANGAFQYHAWDEVWLGTGWVSVDPVFDQFPADVTHIKFVSGDPEDHLAMVGVIGRLRLDVVGQG